LIKVPFDRPLTNPGRHDLERNPIEATLK